MSGRKPLAEAFGRTVRELRLARSLPQLALARSAGLHLDRLAQLEAGAEEPDIAELFAIARALGMRASELLIQVGVAYGEPL